VGYRKVTLSSSFELDQGLAIVMGGGDMLEIANSMAWDQKSRFSPALEDIILL
jgi:hypothetical protein